MSKKLTSLVVSGALLLFMCSTSIIASTEKEKGLANAEKVKATISRIGTGRAARIEVKLRDDTKLKGYVDRVAEDHFVVIDDKTGAKIVSYPQVKQVKGNNLSTGAKIAIGIGVASLFLLFAIAMSDPRAGR